MRTFCAFSVILITSVGCGVSPQTGTTARRIIEGQPSHPGDYPPTVAMLFVEKDPEFGDFAGVGCTGTLIASDVVLTAAHCTVDEEALARDYPGLTVSTYISFEPDLSEFGITTDTLPEDAIRVTAQIPHPDFVGDDVEPVAGLGNDRDIGLIFLETAATVAPAELPTSGTTLSTGDHVAIVGYGQRERDVMSDLAGAKYHAATFLQEVGTYEMQVGGTPVSTTVGPSKCYGDSGGPTFLMDQPLTVVGVTSRSYNLNEDCDEAGVDTRVDAFVPWIQTELERGCADGLRVDCDEPEIPEPMMPPPTMRPPKKQPKTPVEPPMTPEKPDETSATDLESTPSLDARGCTSVGAGDLGALWLVGFLIFGLRTLGPGSRERER